MKEPRLEAYLDLIQELLQCPKGQELALLQANQALIDPQCVQVMDQVATQMAAEGDANAAAFLHTWAEELRNALMLTPETLNAHSSEETATQPSKEARDRTSAYMALIKELINCRKGSEAAILRAHSDLVDTGLIQEMQTVASMLAEKGDEADANFLLGLAHQLSEESLMASTFQLTLLDQILNTIQHSGGNVSEVIPLLQSHVDQLDESFVVMLHTWAEQTLQRADPNQALALAADLVIFGDLVQQLTQGNPAHLLEIALASYQIALPHFPQAAFPKQWAMIQKHLGETYYHRPGGDKAENLETTLRCLQNSLQVYTRESLPHEWAAIQKELGAVYAHRHRGDRTENLEHAVEAYAAALEVFAPREAVRL